MTLGIGEVVSIISITIVLGTIVWRMAVLHAQCFANKDGLLRAHQRIDEVKKTHTDKYDLLVIQLQQMKETIIRMEATLNLLLKLEKDKEEKHKNVAAT